MLLSMLEKFPRVAVIIKGDVQEQVRLCPSISNNETLTRAKNSRRKSTLRCGFKNPVLPLRKS
jgi:hypothetical protein